MLGMVFTKFLERMAQCGSPKASVTPLPNKVSPADVCQYPAVSHPTTAQLAALLGVLTVQSQQPARPRVRTAEEPLFDRFLPRPPGWFAKADNPSQRDRRKPHPEAEQLSFCLSERSQIGALAESSRVS